MTTPAEPTAKPASAKSPGRRIAASMILSLLVFVVLWIAAFTWVASLLIASAFFAVVVAASIVSDLVEMILEAIATVIFVVLAAIAAVIGAIFSLFS